MYQRKNHKSIYYVTIAIVQNIWRRVNIGRYLHLILILYSSINKKAMTCYFRGEKNRNLIMKYKLTINYELRTTLLMNYLKKTFSIHHRNIHSLAIENYKFFHGLSPSIMKNVFHFTTNISYNLWSFNELYSRNPKTVIYGTETISYLAPKIWSLVPNATKSSKSLDVFKSKIRQWETDCPCGLSKNYLHGFP